MTHFPGWNNPYDESDPMPDGCACLNESDCIHTGNPAFEPKTDPTLTDEELAQWHRGDIPGAYSAVTVSVVRRLIAALRAEQERNKELARFLQEERARNKTLEANQVTHEFDEETGYCLCSCCRHGI